MSKFNNFFDKFIYIFLLLTPVISIFTNSLIKNNNYPLSISFILYFISFVIIFIWLLRNYKYNKVLLLIITFFMFSLVYFFGKNKASLLCEFINVINIFYLPLGMILFGAYNNEKINDKLVTKIFLLYELLFIVSSIFKLNLYDNMFISIVLLVLGVVSLNYINNSKNFILKISSYVLLFLCVYFANTVTMYLGTIIIMLYILFRYIKYSRVFNVDKWQKRNIIISVFIIALLIGLCPVMKITHTIKDNKIYTFKKISAYAKYDAKLEVLGRVNNKYTNGKVETYIYGLGKYNLNIIDNINIDIFDIFFSVGIFGLFVYILMVLYNTRFHDLKDKYFFSFIFAIALSMVGSVLINPNISIYLALLYLLSKITILLTQIEEYIK